MNAPLEATAPEPGDLTPANAFAVWALYGRPAMSAPTTTAFSSSIAIPW